MRCQHWNEGNDRWLDDGVAAADALKKAMMVASRDAAAAYAGPTRG
jgi:hypothetical protein